LRASLLTDSDQPFGLAFENPRSFVERCDFVTSVGFGRHAGDRQRLGLRGAGPQIIITDMGILRPDPVTCELVLTDLHPGRTAEQAREATGWPLAVAEKIAVTAPPTNEELATLAALKAA
jgi:acyl CoA:acetate/3-ketoacid CoA transferase beta subunit